MILKVLKWSRQIEMNEPIISADGENRVSAHSSVIQRYKCLKLEQKKTFTFNASVVTNDELIWKGMIVLCSCEFWPNRKKSGASSQQLA